MSSPTAVRTRTSTVKVGLLTVVSLGLLITALIWLRGRGLGGGTSYAVLFKDVDGMRDGAAVQMMGIRVGFVDAVEPLIQNGKYFVKVAFTINKDLGIQLPRGSNVSIEQSGLIGEQFLEITPPQLREITLADQRLKGQAVQPGLPVKFRYDAGYLPVGRVEQVQNYVDNNRIKHRVYYRVTRPGAVMPDDPQFSLARDSQGTFLRILPKEPVDVSIPDPNLVFTVENPLRLKEFLEIQMESAQALKLTNEKINQFLSDETIATLQDTVKNTEALTAKATDALASANKLFISTREDLSRLSTVSEDLARNVTAVSHNLNEVIGDPRLKRDMLATISSLNESSRALRDVLQDPALKQTITLTRDTSQNAAELTGYLNRMVRDEQLQSRLDRSLTLMNTSLDKLTKVLDNVDTLTDDKDQTLKQTLADLRETSKNLKQLSGKFSGHFTLWKLLF